MQRKRVERGSCSYSRSVVHSVGDMQILAYDVFLGVAGVALIVGVPFIVALMKQMGVW